MVPKITEIIPLVRGTVESQRIPSNAAKISTVISVLGRKINNKNKIFTNRPAPMGWVTVVKKAMDKIEARNLNHG